MRITRLKAALSRALRSPKREPPLTSQLARSFLSCLIEPCQREETSTTMVTVQQVRIISGQMQVQGLVELERLYRFIVVALGQQVMTTSQGAGSASD